MQFIHNDNSGNLLAGVFYELILADPNGEVKADWQVSEDDEFDYWIDFTAGKKQEVACAGGHTNSIYRETRFDCQAFDDSTTVFGEGTGGRTVITEQANTALQNAGFCNYRSFRIYPEIHSVFKSCLWGIEYDNVPMGRPLRINDEDPVCPVCKNLMQCNVCFKLFATCRHCKKGSVKFFGSANDFHESKHEMSAFKIPAVMPEFPTVIDGSRWNGEDFVTTTTFIAVTGRVFDILRQEKIGPAYGRPVKVWVDKCSDLQLKMLEKSKSARWLKKTN